MPNAELSQRLSSISTMWSVLRQAHNGPPEQTVAAQRLLLERYGGAVHRYLLAVLRDAHAADDITQEFGLALVRGQLGSATPHRGRFRNYLKATLFHLVSKHRRKEQRLPGQLSDNAPEPMSPTPSQEHEAEFNERWRDELLARTWGALARANATFFLVLRFRAENPNLGSTEMAQEISTRLGKPLTPDGVRQTLHRAREKFADLLLDEVAQSLEAPTVEQLEEELVELNLLEYCRPALDRRTRSDA